MKRLALILSFFAIFFACGGLVVSETVKQNTDEITIIQNPKTPKSEDPKKIIPNSKIPARNASHSEAGGQNPKISENPGTQEQVLGDFNEEAGKLSVNEATIEELDTIPGVGPVTAQKIIDGRPWESLDDALKLISTRYRDAAREKLKL